MGAGASSTQAGGNQAAAAGVDAGLVAEQAEKIRALTKELESTKGEINRLKIELQAAADSNGGGGGDPSVRPSIVRRNTSMMNEAKNTAAKPNRREEVSAEAWNKQRAGKEQTEKYERKVVPKSDDIKKTIQDSVNGNILFKGLRAEEKEECVDAFYKVELNEGDEATTQGDVGDKFFVVESGELAIYVSIQPGAAPANYGSLTKGDSFGELSLMYNTPRAATIRATSRCVLWAINRQDFRNIHLHHKMLRKEQFEHFLKQVPDLSHLTPQELSRLADAVEEEEFEAGSVILREGEIGETFYIILSGEVKYSKREEGDVGTGTTGSYFGHKALLTDEKRAATVTALTKVSVLTMGRDDFVTLLGSLQDLVNRRLDPAETKEETPEEHTEAEVSKMQSSKHKYHKEVLFEDLQLEFARHGRPGTEREIILGQGAFGKVQIVKHKTSGETFALKCLNKSQIVESSLQVHVVNERKVMTMIDHPFLLKLYNSYWDDSYVYLLLELCLGGELFTVLRRAGRFAEKASRFYVATVLQAFDHLHSKNIVYRDLKPENLMLDNGGYIKVVDFGLAKVVQDRTWTLCGTPDYLAPEIILSKGHDKAVDYWALGVLTFELTAGVVPFYADDPLDVYQLVLDGEIRFPVHFSRPLCDLIRKLLNPAASKRLGNTKDGTQGIIKHRFFSGFDWEGLYNRTLVPPIEPSVASPEDTSNFDEYPVQKSVAPKCDWEPPFPHRLVDGKTVIE
ncbi:cGMP-dependent protein kinase 1 [Hondaea fermentalgiana]|uniref:cGMP-dependent protein kinase n=1 Tax=Hondaea fermentalgiana TaxID=2315210 RepID=A0A2R5GRY5_9STRA|nr:cGMP-dependent protein kinase 1 [Hondaea fermentalgiana]|eukprot:GBG33610.1 cGMP-dependent protein kinase 1 [Hondaea fermentalgiana]